MRSMITIIIESKEGVGRNDYTISGHDDDENAKQLVRIWTERGKLLELHSYDERPAPTEDGEMPKSSRASHYS